jgi:hypothetical protein
MVTPFLTSFFFIAISFTFLFRQGNIYESEKAANSQRFILVDTNTYYFSSDNAVHECSIYNLGRKYSEKEVINLIEEINLFFFNFANHDLRYKSAKCGGYGTSAYLRCAMEIKFKNRTRYDFRVQNWYGMFLDNSRGKFISNYSYCSKSETLKGDFFLKKTYALVRVGD